jgi:hypothetical protein
MKNIQIVSRLVARENNYDPELTEDVNDFFWEETRRTLSSMEYTSVSIKCLCTITVSKRKVDYIIRKLIGKIRSIRKSTRFKPSTVELLLEQNYENYAKRTSRIREASSNDNSELRQDIGSNLESSEERIGDANRGGTTGNSEETVDMCDMPVQ